MSTTSTLSRFLGRTNEAASKTKAQRTRCITVDVELSDLDISALVVKKLFARGGKKIKHDGFRILAHRRGGAIRLISRKGHDLADRFPLAAEAVAALPVRSCVIDAEAIVCDDSGLAVFDLIRGHGRNGRAILCAFDLLEVNGEDIRAQPIEQRKHALANLLYREGDGIAFNAHYDGDSAIIYKHACALGCVGTPYRAGRSAHWLKIKNPNAPALRRLEEEDWNG